MKFKFKFEDLIAIFCVLLFSTILSIIPIKNIDNVKSEINEAKSVASNIIGSYKNEEIISQTILDNRYLCMYIKENADDTEKFSSLIYDLKTTDEIEYISLLKDNSLDLFFAKEIELLELKYPKFIVDALKDGSGDKILEFKDNELIIHYFNYIIEPEVDEKILLKINYNEIKDIFNVSFNLDLDYKNEDGYNYDANKNTVALTFDDGPNGEKTKDIIEILKSNKAHATFFMVGNKMQNDANTIKAVLDDGNEIGSHSYKHANITRQSYDEMLDDLNKTDLIYKEITGKSLELLRPPYGSYKKDMLKDLNYSVITWNIDTEDWRYHDVNKISNTLFNNLQDGSIILMHDSYQTTVDAINKILPQLYAKGYQVVSVSELAKIKGVQLQKNTSYRKIK